LIPVKVEVMVVHLMIHQTVQEMVLGLVYFEQIESLAVVMLMVV
jgi:hypothetical protein